MSSPRATSSCSGQRGVFRVVLPWGRDRGRQATIISEHETPAVAFAALDRLVCLMASRGAPLDAMQFEVTDSDGQTIRRQLS